MLPIRTILCPVDFSEPAQLEFRLACALAHDYHARLIAVHAAQPPVVIYTPTGDMLPTRLDFRLAAQAQLTNMQGPKDGRAQRRVSEGEAGTEILGLAGENQVDLIVMSTQGRTGLDRLVVGSVAEEVLRKAPCPVLTVKAPAARSAAAARVGANAVLSAL